MRRSGDGLVPDRLQRAVRVGAERHGVDRAGAVAEGEHLVARQFDPDRALQLQRRHDGEEQLVLRPQARAEGAADKG